MVRSNQYGRSMVEMLGVLAIIGVLSVAGIAGYSKAMEKYNTNKLVDQFFIILHNLTTAVAGGQPVTQLANNTVVDALRILPTEMGKAAKCRHALGGQCYVTGGGDGTIISIRFKDLPPKACIELSTIDLRGAKGKSIVNAANSITVTSSACAVEDGEGNCKSSQFRSIAQATKECRGKLNAVIFTFNVL